MAPGSSVHKLRKTPARIEILDIIRSSPVPLGAPDIQQQLQAKGIEINPVTVYRTLETFVDAGTLVRLEGKFRYELADTRHHHHAICERCGTITDTTDCIGPDIVERISEKTGYEITSHALEFYGICAACQQHTAL